MAVLFISHKYPPAVGGMEKQSYELINGYQKVDKSYSIVYQKEETRLIFFLKLRIRLTAMINRHSDINIIHLNDGLMAAIFWLLHINVKNIKVIVTWHGLDLVYPLKIYQKIILQKIKNYDAFICVSSATASECIKRGFDKKKIFVVHNGVDHQYFQINHTKSKLMDFELLKQIKDIDRKKIILGIGRPVRRKGFSWFASQVLPHLPPDIIFIHIGNVNAGNKWYRYLLPLRIVRNLDLLFGHPDDISDLKAIANDNSRVILLGQLKKDWLEHIKSKSHIVVMPNITVNGDMEGFGLVALEASIMGKTVIAANIEGLTDSITDGKNGIKAISGSSEDWITKINTIMPKVKQYDDDIRNYTCKKFSWDKMVDGYKDIFNKIQA